MERRPQAEFLREGDAWTGDAVSKLVDEGTQSVTLISTMFTPGGNHAERDLPAEDAGQSANGQVCTWQAISGCTEEGRRYSDYASCDIVRSQRPYYPAPPAATAGREDKRLEDSQYVAELDWVKS